MKTWQSVRVSIRFQIQLIFMVLALGIKYKFVFSIEPFPKKLVYT
jgi:hypothetical protein